MFTINRILIYF